MSAVAMPVPSAGPQRVGRYLVFAPFAHGGMASVHMGKLLGSSGFSRLVAIKRLHPMFASSEQHYKMLLEEARIASRISHPNVVPILDVVQEPNDLLLVMEYVTGVSLADLLVASYEYGEPPPPAIAAAVVVDVLRGLHAAHEARSEDGALLGVVHRDVSPHNVLVGVDGAARVLDFGIAKALRKDHLTVSGDLKGKASYLAPEQLRGLPATRQTDIFSAGIVLWESLVGTRLYYGEPALAMMKILEEDPKPPSAHVPSLSRAVDAVVMRALSREPRERFSTAEEMALELIDAIAPATREDVARFVQTMASSELDRRKTFAREAERSLTPPEGSPALPVDASTGNIRAASASSGVIEKPSRIDRRLLVFGAGTAVAVAIGAGVFAAARTTNDATSIPAATAQPPTASATASTVPAASPAPSAAVSIEAPAASESAKPVPKANRANARPSPKTAPRAGSAPEDSTAASDRK